MRLQVAAKGLLQEWRGKTYSFGPGALDAVGRLTAGWGSRALVVASGGRWLRGGLEAVLASLGREGVTAARAVGARPNAPREDVLRLAAEIAAAGPEVVVAVGGGSTIDAVKAAVALEALGATGTGAAAEAALEGLFGTGQVSAALAASGGRPRPVVAVQTAASSAAHLTKYANVTDPASGQKRLMVDQALTPVAAVFDYSLAGSAPASLVLDGAFDGLAHCLEVLWGTPPGDPRYELVSQVAATGAELIVKYLPVAAGAGGGGAGAGPNGGGANGLGEAQVALGLGTDLGGYAIMLGGTSGPHLNSFSLVHLASHGQACGVLNPYWTVFLAPAIEPQLRLIGDILLRYGYLETDPAALGGLDLGRAVARAWFGFAAGLGYPTSLGELPGWEAGYIDRALEAARDPRLAMKLRNLPVPLAPGDLEEYLRPLLAAAAAGDYTLIREHPDLRAREGLGQ